MVALHMAAYKVPRLVDFTDALPAPAPARSSGGLYKRKSGRRIKTLNHGYPREAWSTLLEHF